MCSLTKMAAINSGLCLLFFLLLLLFLFLCTVVLAAAAAAAAVLLLMHYTAKAEFISWTTMKLRNDRYTNSLRILS